MSEYHEEVDFGFVLSTPSGAVLVLLALPRSSQRHWTGVRNGPVWLVRGSGLSGSDSSDRSRVALSFSPVPPHALAKLLDLLEDGRVSSSAAKTVRDTHSLTPFPLSHSRICAHHTTRLTLSNES